MSRTDLTPDQRAFAERYLGPQGGLELAPLVAVLEYLVFATRHRRGRGATLHDLVQTQAAIDILPWATDLGDDEFKPIQSAYVSAVRSVMDLEDRLDGLKETAGLTDSEIDAAIDSWGAAYPERDADWFGDFLVRSQSHVRTAEAPIEDEFADAVAFFSDIPAVEDDDDDVDTVPTARRAAPNNTGDTKMTAPDDILSAESRRALLGYDGVGLSSLEDIAGTGGIHEIIATRNEDMSLEVAITGEIIPGRLQRKRSKDLKDGQTYAPSLEKVSVLSRDELRDRGLNNPDDWERLHLWGPGFGDEAAAGIYLGPREINQELQNRGIEKLIRNLARLVLSVRDDGYRLDVRATMATWPFPTPGGLAIERIFRRVAYDLLLTVPDDSVVTATTSLEMKTDPALVNEGEPIRIRLDADPSGWRALRDALPADLL